ncbi:MAG: DUF4013 domain-containing protein [Anaerolineae bacterium]
MDFSAAISYSLKKQNIARILTIVLVGVILGVSVFVGFFMTESVGVLFLFVPLVIIYGLFLGGYVISVIESVLAGDPILPRVALGRDIRRGFMVGLATFVYAIPMMFAIMIPVSAVMLTGDASNDFDQVGAMTMLMLCGGLIVAMVLTFALGFSLVVGQVRYAIEGRAGALFNVGKNFGIVMSNIGTTFGLFFRQLGVAFIFGIVASILSNVIMAFFGGVTNDLFIALERGNYNRLFDAGMLLLLAMSLYYVISLTFNLMQSFSNAHLMAGYGIDLGLYQDHRKPKNDDFDF